MDTFRLLADEAYKRNGITSFWFGNNLYVNVADPFAADKVMKTSLEKDEVMDLARPLIGNGSIFAPVTIWRPRRKVLAPTFGQKTLNNFVKIFYKQSAILADQLQSVAGKEKFSIFNYVTTYSMDSICETTMGVNVNAQRNINHPVLKAFNGFCQMSAARFIRPWLHPPSVYKFMPKYSTYIEHSQLLNNFYAMMSMKTVIATIIRNYRILPAEDQELNSCASKANVEVKYEIMMKHVDNFQIRLEKRSINECI
ncbi:cytochrome P450 4C1-like [Galleria mellonella]|uniref:Cytochrome P450 4C1-like n=1 Tax=Galleria mellonella TaxID=7137 RepID=A0ABM3MPT6_GALME|nr:cytochrome P450 4C1-like [Galleria mellonella]